MTQAEKSRSFYTSSFSMDDIEKTLSAMGFAEEIAALEGKHVEMKELWLCCVWRGELQTLRQEVSPS